MGCIKLFASFKEVYETTVEMMTCLVMNMQCRSLLFIVLFVAAVWILDFERLVDRRVCAVLYVCCTIALIIILFRQFLDWKSSPDPRAAASELAEPLCPENPPDSPAKLNISNVNINVNIINCSIMTNVPPGLKIE